MSKNDYPIACIMCGRKRGLMMFGYRNKEKIVTGFVFKCSACHKLYPSLDIQVEVSDE